MGDDRPEYSGHARKRLTDYRIDEDDVESIIAYPSIRYGTKAGVEHVGWSSDGRPFRVVTTRDERIVITIVDVERRSRARRMKR